jgi:uncharacterized membrane protein
MRLIYANRFRFTVLLIIGLGCFVEGFGILNGVFRYYADFNYSTKDMYEEEANSLFTYSIVALIFLINGMFCTWGGIKYKRKGWPNKQAVVLGK